jgi:GntR family transcriptional regulator, transcriptional repressor for pyruvate dehydrogenase complex
MPFQPIKLKKVSSQIAAQLRSSILNGDFSTGDRLPPERELAVLFGVSRPTVREAINTLQSAGLVASVQGGGTLVTSLVATATPHPLRELIRVEQERALDVIEVRKCLESQTAYYAARRARPDDLRLMGEIIDSMGRNLEGDYPSEDLDANLHVVIARATHNMVWMHLMQNLFDAMQEFQQSVWRAVHLTREDHLLLFGHHRAIVEAITAGDADAARQAMLVHLEFAEQRSAAYLTRQKK